MAEEEAQANPQENAADEPAAQKKSGSIVPMIIIAAVVVVCAGAGLGLGRLFAGSGNTETTTTVPPAEETAATEQPASNAPDVAAGNTWFYDLEPVVANLDEPGATRYVRAALTLEIGAGLAPDKGNAFLEQKKPLLTNLLTIYLAGLNVEATRGDKNLKRIQMELCDTFNERLFPDGKPVIERILIKEFAVQ